MNTIAVVFSFFIIPAYTQSENNNSADNGFQFTSTIGLAIAVVGGIFDAFVFFTLLMKYEQTKTRQDIDKVRYLIQTDIHGLHS